MSTHPRAAIAAVGLALALIGAACAPSAAPDEATITTEVGASTTSTTRPDEPSTNDGPSPVVEESLEALLKRLIAGTELHSLGVTVFNSEGIIESAVTGIRRAGDPAEVELLDEFSIGSNTKAMTATLVARYVDDGEITWDTTFGDVFGGLLPGLHEDFSDVTIRQLLNHTGGIDDDLAYGPLLAEADWDTSVVEQRAATARITLSKAPHNAVGTFMYSNIGYTLAGAMLEEITGRFWEDLITAHIFEPLEMTRCGFYAPGTPGTVDQPWGHFTELDGKAMDPGDPDAEYPHVLAPAGMVHCSMEDWATFLQSQLRGFQGSSDEIISGSAFAELKTTPEGSDYALGWLTIPAPGGLVLNHNGSNDRFTSEALLIPDADLGVLVVTNLGEVVAGPIVSGTIQAMIERHLIPSTEQAPAESE